MTRYSKLQPLTPRDAADFAYAICVFFSPANNAKYRAELELPPFKTAMTPLSMGDFFAWQQQHGVEIWSLMNQMRALVQSLLRAGFLTHAGTKHSGPPFLSEHYYFTHEWSKRAGKGSLWLGAILGAPFIATEIQPYLAMITGTTSAGDPRVGTGMALQPDFVITCAHVVKDMKLDATLSVGTAEFSIKDVRAHATHDVAGIVLDRALPAVLPDLAFRDASNLEEVVIPGYPTVPRGLTPIVIHQRGEICAFLPDTMDRSPVLLFSAIARPGNSGGPVVAMDGTIVGIVARSLERQIEAPDSSPPLPFFAAVPARTIVDSIGELYPERVMPWENYE